MEGTSYGALETLAGTELGLTDIVYSDSEWGDIPAGQVKVEIIKGNVVITVYREDEAYFGPVSLVVV